ncbi:Rha family transcriptional regulator [Leptospira levettii]|uniref:Rha family transcriptional regulator n=1 Tax=Leptospira levettii TaxID=2023178 RepID=UPI00223E5031|nr:Rha family transcriptional regulator [Leptospira levettii]MCW7467507.1 Rha family transcriptional regulator [Leptospira levettii]
MNFLEDLNKTMSSLEIAELTKKRHDNVLRDIETQLAIVEGGLLRFEGTYIHPQNRQRYRIYRLPFRETMIVVSGYNVTLRTKIIDRWLELEQKQREQSSLEGDLLKAKGNLPPSVALVWSVIRILQGEGQYCTVPLRGIREIICGTFPLPVISRILLGLEKNGWVIRQTNPGKPSSYCAIVPRTLKYNINEESLRFWASESMKPNKLPLIR